MEIKEISREVAINKIIEIHVTMDLNNNKLLKLSLRYGFRGYDNYTDLELERELARIIDETVIWKII